MKVIKLRDKKRRTARNRLKSLFSKVRSTDQKLKDLLFEWGSDFPELEESVLVKEFSFLLIKRAAFLAGSLNCCSKEEMLLRWESYYNLGKKQRGISGK